MAPAVPSPKRTTCVSVTVPTVAPVPETAMKDSPTQMMTTLLSTGAHTGAPNLPRVLSMALDTPLSPMKKI